MATGSPGRPLSAGPAFARTARAEGEEKFVQKLNFW